MKKITLLINRYEVSKRQLDAFDNILQTEVDDLSVLVDSYSRESKIVRLFLDTYDPDLDTIEYIKEPKNLAERNKYMIDRTDHVIGFPDLMNDKEDSSFWKTIRYAKANKKKVTIISQIGNVWELRG